MKFLDMKFRKQARKVDKKLARAQNASILLLALTSTFILYNLTNTFFGQYISNVYIRVFICSLCIYALLEAIDLGLKTFLPYVSIEILSGQYKTSNKSRKWFVFGLLFVCLVQLVATSALTFLSADDITAITIEKPDFQEIEKVSSTRTGQFQTVLEEMKADIAAAKKNEKRRISNAKFEGRNIVKNAEESKGAKMAQLYRSGNGWARKQLAPTLSKAKKDSADLVQKELGLIASLDHEKMTFIKNQTANDAAILQPLADWQKSEIQEYQSTKQTRNSLIKYAAILFAFGFVFFTFLRANYVVATMEDPHPTEEESTKSFLDISQKGLKKVYQHGLNQLDKFIATPFKLQFATSTIEASQKVDNQGETLTRKKTRVNVPRKRGNREKYDVSMYKSTPIIEEKNGAFALKMTLADGTNTFFDETKVREKIRNIKRRINEIEPLVKYDPENYAKTETLRNRKLKKVFFDKALSLIQQEKFNA